MGWTWERWKISRKIVHRDNNGRFAKGNFHVPEDWKQYGRVFSKEVREKISKTLKGMPFTNKRKRNISRATKAANYKWAKTCKHGISPLYKCKECFRKSHIESLRRFRKRRKLLNE